VTVATGFGETLTCQSVRDIRVDGEVPGLYVVGPPTSKESEVHLRLEWLGDSPDTLEEIFVYSRKLPLGKWKPLTCRLRGETVSVHLPDGRWELYTGGTDLAGNRTPAPSENTRGYVITVDTVPPVLAVHREPEGRSILAGSLVSYTCRIRDEHIDPLTLTMSIREGQEGEGEKGKWIPVRSAFPADLPVEYMLPEREGVFHVLFTVEDLAGNKAAWVDMIELFTPEPTVELSIPAAGVFPGGSTVSAAWRTADTGVNPEVAVFLSVDGGESWKTIGRKLPHEGRIEVKLPTVDTHEAFLKVSVVTRAGKTAEAAVGPFAVSTAPPEAAVSGTVLKP